MTGETIAITSGAVLALLAGLKMVIPYLSKRPKLAAGLGALLVVSVVILVALVVTGCRSAIPVTIKTQNFQCSTVVTNDNGEVDLRQSDCIRSDGDQAVDAAGGAGDDKLEVPVELPFPSKAGFSPSPN